MTAASLRVLPSPPPGRHQVPPNLFGIGFGIAGLGEAWLVTADAHRTPAAVSTVLFVLAAACWLTVLTAYLVAAGRDRHVLVRDLLDPAAAPFLSLAVITPMLLAAVAIHPHAATTGTVAVDAGVVLTVALGSWLTGQWIYGPLTIDDLHPGYFLPTVAGGFLAATSAAAVGQPRLAATMFGLGLICWLVLGSIVLNRLLTRPLPPDPLLPTLAIEVAPAAVASLAWFALHGAQIDTVAELLAGYGLLMALAQLRLLPAYLRLPFRPSTWAFTFSWAAVTAAALTWLDTLRPATYQVWQDILLTLISALVAGIGARTVLALTRHDLLPQPAVTA